MGEFGRMEKKSEYCANEDKEVAVNTSVISIVANMILSVFKLLAGIFASSAAMVSDAIHSASDVFSSIIVIIGINIASKESDENHPYGHERFEPIAAILLANVLCITGFFIGRSGVIDIIDSAKAVKMGETGSVVVPGVLALWAAVVSIVVKEGMYRFTVIRAKRINSTALMADAWHHRSDALSSIGALVGILFAQHGVAMMDSIASLVICLFIIKAAYEIFKDAIDKLVDRSCGAEFEAELEKEILSVDGVCNVDTLRTRNFGNRVYAEIEIAVDGELRLNQSHAIAEKVHDLVEASHPIIKHITVHVNPSPLSSRSEVRK